MDAALPLEPLHPRLPLDRPFTPASARAVGVDRACLERMLRSGTTRRLLRGVYLSSAVEETVEVRAEAVALVAGPAAIAVDRTAAWVHGVDLGWEGQDRAPLELVSSGGGRGPAGRGARQLTGRDVQRAGPLRLTTPLRTALDLGRLLPPDQALGAMDALLSHGTFTHVQLLAEVPRMTGHRAVGQLRVLAAQADARSSGMAESVLRRRWHEARLPSAVPGLPVCAGGRLVRLGLGVERRQYGAVLAGAVPASDLVALEGAGWHVVVLSAERVLHADPATLIQHLEREFHQQLLAQAV